MGRDRGDLVVFYEYVLATMRNVVGVLAGLNRVYVAPEKLKRVGAVVSGMELTPPNAAARLDALLDLPREQVEPELDDLVARTLDLVDEHLPEVDTTARSRGLVAAGRSRAITRRSPAPRVPGPHVRQRQERAAEREQRGGSAGRMRRRFARRARGPGLARRGRGACRGGRLGRAGGALGDDPELGSPVLGQTTGSDEPATEDGIDLDAGENADATTDGGPEPPVGVEPDLKDVAAAQRRADADSAG